MNLRAYHDPREQMVSMLQTFDYRLAKGFDESRGRLGKPQEVALGPQRRAFHFFLNLLKRWVRWFKTTNAHRAQPAALRHKRALKALLGKTAEKIMGFLGRNRRVALQQSTSNEPR